MSVVPKSPRHIATQLERIPRTMHALLLAMFLIAGCATASVMAFSYLHVHHGFARTMARYVPYPAYVVDGKIVWYSEISERANALEALAGLSDDEAITRAATLSVRHKALLGLAEELGVQIPQSEVDVFVASDTAFVLLQSTAAWRRGDYYDLGVRSYLFAQTVERAALASESMQRSAFGRATRLQTKLTEGIPFFEIAQQYSDGVTSAAGGDLGYMAIEEVPAPWATFVASAAIGDESSILASETSLWIVRLEDRLAAEEGTTVQLSVIEVKKDLLHDILEDRMEELTVVQLLR